MRRRRKAEPAGGAAASAAAAGAAPAAPARGGARGRLSGRLLGEDGRAAGLQQVRERVGQQALEDDPVREVRPVEARAEHRGAADAELREHVVRRGLRRRRRERDERHGGEVALERAQVAEGGPEVVAPLAHAVRLVDGEEAQQAARVQLAQHVLQLAARHALGGHVQQLDRGPARARVREVREDGRLRLRGLRAEERRGDDAAPPQRRDLVVH
jgi:hypothetical protein